MLPSQLTNTLSRVLTFAPLIALAVLAWLYAGLKVDIDALHQENTLLAQSIEQHKVIQEATAEEFKAWKERNGKIIESYTRARKDLYEILSANAQNSDFGSVVVPDDVLILLNGKSCSSAGGSESAGGLPAGKRDTSSVR